MKAHVFVLAGVMAVMLSGCSWVKLVEGADRIAMVSEQQAAECERLGRTRVQVAHRIGFIPRNEEAIQEDLDDMARNEAVDMGGDTIAPMEEAEEGRQNFGIYRCRN